LRRLVPTVTGLAMGLAAAIGLCAAMGEPWLASLRAFSANITQGTYEEGWRLPFDYLWHAEHGLMLLWLAALAWGVAQVVTGRASRSLKAGLAATIVIYAALAGLSTGLHVFVVYGRLARQLVPFLCLVSARAVISLAGVRAPRRRGLVAAIVVAAAIQAGVNFAGPIRQEFPLEFTRRSVALARRMGRFDVVLVNAHHIYPAPDPVVVRPGAYALASARHPLQYLPYQYEGYTPDERRVLRKSDLRMQAFIGVADRITDDSK
jgi:hypothetical protein